MKFFACSVLVLLSLTVSAFEEKDLEAEFDKKVRAILLAQYKGTLKIAQKACKDKYYTKSRIYFDNIVKNLEDFEDAKLEKSLGHLRKKLEAGEKSISEGNKKLKYDSFVHGSKAKKLSSGYFANYQKKVLDKKLKSSNSLLKWAQREKYEEGILKACERIVELSHDDKKARALLKHEKVEPYGWLEEEAAKAAKEGKFEFEGKWLTKEKIAEKKGKFKTVFPISFPQSSLDFVYERTGAKTIDKKKKSAYNNHRYKIKDETFEIYVPAKYDGKEKYGLFVYINSSDNGGSPKKWHKVFDDHKIIYVGANKSGNKQDVTGRRIPFAVDAALNMKLRYNIDESRIYISGFSGGGRTSSGVSVAYPDIFRGALYICGCNAPRSMPPSKELVSFMTTRNRYVFLTGEKDFNLGDTKGVLSAYKGLKVKNTKFLSVPEMAHNTPGEAWFKKAIEYLDER